MSMDKPEIVAEVEQLSESVREEIRDSGSILELERRRNNNASTLKSPLGLLAALLLALLLTSSCSLHAGEVIGRWDVEDLSNTWSAQPQAFIDAAREQGSFAYVLAYLFTAVVSIPVGICLMPVAPLRILAELAPVTKPFLPYVELTIIVVGLAIAFRMAEPFSHNRKVRKQLRQIDSQLHEQRGQLGRDLARLNKLWNSKQYREAKERWDRWQADKLLDETYENLLNFAEMGTSIFYHDEVIFMNDVLLGMEIENMRAKLAKVDADHVLGEAYAMTDELTEAFTMI